MRLKDYRERDGKRVWLSESEIQLFIDQAESREQRLAFLLAARAGLRRQEIVDVRLKHVVETDHGHVVRVWDGKGEKYREVPAPDEVKTAATMRGYDGDGDERLVGTEHGATVYRWVRRAAEACEAETGDEGWQFLDVHDLRRSWGVRTLEAGVLPSVVMEFGGWTDWETFRNHYLSEFSPEALRRERRKLSWLSESTATDDASGGSQPGYAAVETPSGDRY